MNCTNNFIKTGKEEIKKEEYSNDVYKINHVQLLLCRTDKKKIKDAFKRTHD